MTEIKNDKILEKKVDAVQTISSIIATLPAADIEKIVAFASSLKNEQKITVADNLKIARLSLCLDETFSFLERIQGAMEYLENYFSIGKSAMTNEIKQRIFAEYDQNRVMFDIAFDYMIHINCNCNRIRDNLNSLESTVEQEKKYE